MADKITDEELAEELKAYGEVVKVPIDRKKRPILIKKLNHLKARDRPASHGKKVTPSRTRPTKTIEFSSAEESEEETAGPIGRMLGRQGTQKEPVLSYSKTDTIEISPPRTRLGARRSSRRAGVGGTSSETAANSSGTGKSMYPDLSQEVTRNASNTSRNYSFEYQNEFTDSDPEESVYEVENKSMNTTFPLQDSLDGDYESPLNRSVKQRRSLGRGKPKKSEKKATWSSDNNITDNKDGRDERDGHFNQSYEPRASFISTSILCLVIGFFLVVGTTYIYLRQETGSMNGEQGVESDVVYGDLENTTKAVKALELVSKLEDDLRKKGNGEKVKWTKLENEILHESSQEDRNNAKLLICLNPGWNIRAYDENQTEIGDKCNNSEAIYYLQADPYLGLIARIGKSMEQILYGIVLLLSCVGLMILAFIGWRYHRNKVEREQKFVFELVEKIIDLVKDNYELHQGNSRHPEFIPVSHVRDQLLPPKQRQKLRPRWEKAVKFIEANESRIRIENQSVQGEEFLVWRWLPACSNGGKYWQGQAFGENNSTAGSGATLPYSPTPCLKIRNMFDAEMETEEEWELNVQDAILEKCKGIPGILHIFVDPNSKEGCVYLKCNSCETAYKVYKSLHGCWFDGRLVTVKYLRLELYHNKFPESKQALKSLQPSNSKMTSLAQPYHRSTLELT